MIHEIGYSTAVNYPYGADGAYPGRHVGNVLYDRKDTNRDGIVSYAEELDWAVRHPGEDVFGKKLEAVENAGRNATYNQTGDLSSGTGSSPGLISLYA
jgi:hypothetical protein